MLVLRVEGDEFKLKDAKEYFHYDTLFETIMHIDELDCIWNIFTQMPNMICCSFTVDDMCLYEFKHTFKFKVKSLAKLKYQLTERFSEELLLLVDIKYNVLSEYIFTFVSHEHIIFDSYLQKCFRLHFIDTLNLIEDED